eukprot:gene28682-32396_t
MPYDSYDQAFVPGQNWGALESPGCVTYRDELLPRGRVTDLARSQRASVIAHEMAHMWFGNLVTMTWWEDTWLQESFADYMGYRVSADGAGFAGALLQHELLRKPSAYQADERRSTHPVAPEAEDVPDVDAASNNFDAISYSKGNSVLRQLVTWLGDEAFLAGVNAYLGAHRLGNGTLADFMAALDSASDRDVLGWVDVWLRTSGFDTIRVSRDGGADGVPVVTRDGTRPHRLRLTSYDEGADAVGAADLVPGQCQRVDPGGREVDRDGADGLHAVGVDGDAGRGGERDDLVDGLERADLVVGPHDRDQGDRRGVALDARAQRLEVEAAVAVDGQQLDLGALVLAEPEDGVEDRVVLHRGGEHAGAAGVGALTCPEDALEGEVVGLGATGGEDDLAGSTVDGLGDGLARLLHDAPCATPGGVQRARVADVEEVCGECVDRRGHHRCGGGVVEVDDRIGAGLAHRPPRVRRRGSPAPITVVGRDRCWRSEPLQPRVTGVRERDRV